VEPVNEMPHVAWPFNSDTLDIPIVDITNPHFALDETSSNQTSLQQLYEAEERRQAKTPRLLRTIALRLGARQSRLLHGLVHSATDHLDGLHTYLMKLGAENLPSGFNTPIDRKVAATPHATYMRLRLQQCATLLAESLQNVLQQFPSKPLHLINIAGGPAIDSLNALIVLHRKDPALLRRAIRLLVLDIDTIGPAFGARAAAVLVHPGNPLSGLDLHYEHQPYDWNDTRSLIERIRQSIASDAILAASAEGGLFEYANDSAIVANLKALAAQGRGATHVVGSVTSSDPLRCASIKRAQFKLVPRGVEGFRPLADQAGFEVTRVEHTPLSKQVVLSPKKDATQREGH
jgi:hypothetical protein